MFNSLSINFTKCAVWTIVLLHRTFLCLKREDFKAKNKYNDQFGDISEEKWKEIYLLPRQLLLDNRIKDLQYKTLSRIIATNSVLYKMKKNNSPNCRETIGHLFYDCTITKNFLFKVIERWNNF